MSMWLESIANLQRRRGPPFDMDDDGNLIPIETKICSCCGNEKPKTSFRHRYDRRLSSGVYVQPKCKDCEKPVKAAKQTSQDRVLAVLIGKKAATLNDICEGTQLTRTPVGRAIMRLINKGKVDHIGFVTRGTNTRVPLYGVAK